MNPQEIARSPSVKDNIGTQYSGLRTAAKTTRASAVLVTSQLVSNHVVSKSTQRQIQNCVNLTCPHLKKKTEDGFYGLHAHPFVGNAFVVFDRSRFGAKKTHITLPTVPLCIRASDFEFISWAFPDLSSLVG